MRDRKYLQRPGRGEKRFPPVKRSLKITTETRGKEENKRMDSRTKPPCSICDRHAVRSRPCFFMTQGVSIAGMERSMNDSYFFSLAHNLRGSGDASSQQRNDPVVARMHRFRGKHRWASPLRSSAFIQNEGSWENPVAPLRSSRFAGSSEKGRNEASTRPYVRSGIQIAFQDPSGETG